MSGRRLNVCVTRLEDEKWYPDWQKSQLVSRRVDQYLKKENGELVLPAVSSATDLSVKDSDDQLLRELKLQHQRTKRYIANLAENQKTLPDDAEVSKEPKNQQRQHLLTNLKVKSEILEPTSILADGIPSLYGDAVGPRVQNSQQSPRNSTTIGCTNDEKSFPWNKGEAIPPADVLLPRGDHAEELQEENSVSLMVNPMGNNFKHRVSSSPVQSRTGSPLPAQLSSPGDQGLIQFLASASRKRSCDLIDSKPDLSAELFPPVQKQTYAPRGVKISKERPSPLEKLTSGNPGTGIPNARHQQLLYHQQCIASAAPDPHVNTPQSMNLIFSIDAPRRIKPLKTGMNPVSGRWKRLLENRKVTMSRKKQEQQGHH